MQESFVVVRDEQNLATLGDSDDVEDIDKCSHKKKKKAKSPANKKKTLKTTSLRKKCLQETSSALRESRRRACATVESF